MASVIGRIGSAIIGGNPDSIDSLLGLGGTESPADLSKQRIQEQLASSGYSQFSKMQGWGGDEKAKKQAMQKILSAIQSYGPQAASDIESYLDGGQITPRTINRLDAKYPTVQSPVTGDTATDTNKPIDQYPTATTTTQSPGFGNVPGWTWAAGGSLLLLLLWLLTQGRPTA